MTHNSALLYLIGPPGCGKSTTAAHLLAGTTTHQIQPAPGLTVTEHHTPTGHVIAQLGAQRPLHPGTDTLGYNALPIAKAWLTTPQARSYPLILGEGDRLAHTTLWTTAQQAGYTVVVIHLHTPPQLARERRRQRRTNQDPSWVKGRATRVDNLTRAWPVITVDAAQPPQQVAQAVRHHIPDHCWSNRG